MPFASGMTWRIFATVERPGPGADTSASAPAACAAAARTASEAPIPGLFSNSRSPSRRSDSSTTSSGDSSSMYPGRSRVAPAHVVQLGEQILHRHEVCGQNPLGRRCSPPLGGGQPPVLRRYQAGPPMSALVRPRGGRGGTALIRSLLTTGTRSGDAGRKRGNRERVVSRPEILVS